MKKLVESSHRTLLDLVQILILVNAYMKYQIDFLMETKAHEIFV